MKSLKAQNIWKIAAFIAMNALVFGLVVTVEELEIGHVIATAAEIRLKDGFLGLVALLFAVAFNGVLGSNTKARLVFWRIRNPLPGCRAFTHLAKDDPRIDLSEIERRFGTLPTDPEGQNQLWYRIFKRQEEDPGISTAHQDYLLTRDMAGLSALFLLTFGIPAPFLAGWDTLAYSAVLLVQYLLLSRVAANYGTRLVCNVLAVESAAGKIKTGQGDVF